MKMKCIQPWIRTRITNFLLCDYDSWKKLWFNIHYKHKKKIFHIKTTKKFHEMALIRKELYKKAITSNAMVLGRSAAAAAAKSNKTNIQSKH